MDGDDGLWAELGRQDLAAVAEDFDFRTEERARSGSHIVGEAYSAGGDKLAEVHLSGVDGYSFTGEVLAWGAERAAAGDLKGVGALGPVDGFGLDKLEAGVAEAGIRRI